MPNNAEVNQSTGKWTMATQGWPTERWVGVIVIISLAMLIAIRMGFRGVNVLGANVSVG